MSGKTGECGLGRGRPAGTLIARWYCRESHQTFSLLPDCLAALLPGTLWRLEEVVAHAEQASSLMKVADHVLSMTIENCAFLPPDLYQGSGCRTLPAMAAVRTVSPPVETSPVAESPTAADFPGCRPVRLPRQELDDCEMRLEYWDAATETAWICDPVSSYHEGPARLLTESARLIAQVRGAPVKCLGSTDLTQRDAQGEPRLIMQADEMVYLHPVRARLPRPVLTIGEHDFPDVVLEVDHSTDARRRKLPQYEAWGFPEVWIEVPEADAPSRPRSRRSGLTIHLLEDGSYREAAASRAFPGWTAAEIHAALNEETFSAETSAALERVGAVLGEREGTGPDDDPLLGAQRRRSRAEGHAAGRAEGRAEGLAALARALLAARGVEVSEPAFPGVPGFAELPEHVIAEAATGCVSEADFLKRLRSR